MKKKKEFLIDEVLTYPRNLKIYSYVCHKMMKLKANKKRDMYLPTNFLQVLYVHKNYYSKRKIWKSVFILYFKAKTISGTRLFLIGILKMRSKGLKQTK